MRFIHCADLHLGSKINLPLEISRAVKEENFRSFERLCEYAEKSKVTAVIICGDSFDLDRVSTATIRRALFAISKAKDVDFLFLTGNHDRNTLSSSDVNFPSNLKFFGEEWTKFSYGNVDIHGVSFNGKNDAYVYDFINLDQDKINIVAMHGEVVGYKSNEKAEIISIPRLKNKGIDYLALGHVHSYVQESLDLRGVYSYSGCLQGRGFDELDQKGFVQLEIEDNKVLSKFTPFSLRNFYEHKIDLSNYVDYFAFREDLKKELLKCYDKNSLIKVTVEGEMDENFDFDEQGLIDYLSYDFFYVKIKNKTTLKISLKDYELDKSMKGEFVRTVFNSDLSEEDKQAVILLGLKALKGEK